MLLFGLWHGDVRLTLDINPGMTVKEIREEIQRQLNIGVDLYKQDKKILVLSWGGTDLCDPWVVSDLNIVPGATIRIKLKEEVKPVLYIHCSHSQDTLCVYDNLTIGNMPLEELRSWISHRSGLPVGIFRLTNEAGTEMYDGHRLEDYGIDIGHTIYLQNMDGWNEFLNLAIMGFTPQVVSQIPQEEINGRYQMKVTLYLAAHFGHVDLARAMLRQGIQASDPVGYPPSRMWCPLSTHLESKKAAVHEAVEMGQLGVLRLFVNHDITVITAPDGLFLTPLNIALRKKIKSCASFLLSKQLSKVNLTKTFAVSVDTYTKLRKWCQRAKERVFLKYGHAKSSLKRRLYIAGPLVGYGVQLDGFSASNMTGKPKALLQKEKEKRHQLLPTRQSQLSEAVGSSPVVDPETYFRRLDKQLRALMEGGKAGDKWNGRRTHKMALSEKWIRSDHAAKEKSVFQPFRGHQNQKVGDSLRLPPIVQTSGTRSTNPPASNVWAAENQHTAQQLTFPSGKANLGLIRSRGTSTFLTASHEQHEQISFQGHAGVLSSQLPKQAIFGPIEKVKTESGHASSEVMVELRQVQKIVRDSADVDSSVMSDDERREKSNREDVVMWFGDSPARLTKRKRRKRGPKLTSSSLLFDPKSKEGAMPLPLVSTEQQRRPFFYYNGHRDQTFIEPTIRSWTKYASSDTPRERAIQSLSVANSFSDKPWLSQVRIALKISSNPLKRDVRRLTSAKRILAV